MKDKITKACIAVCEWIGSLFGGMAVGLGCLVLECTDYRDSSWHHYTGCHGSAERVWGNIGELNLWKITKRKL